jgi:hypothetical protein
MPFERIDEMAGFLCSHLDAGDILPVDGLQHATKPHWAVTVGSAVAFDPPALNKLAEFCQSHDATAIARDLLTLSMYASDHKHPIVVMPDDGYELLGPTLLSRLKLVEPGFNAYAPDPELPEMERVFCGAVTNVFKDPESSQRVFVELKSQRTNFALAMSTEHGEYATQAMLANQAVAITVGRAGDLAIDAGPDAFLLAYAIADGRTAAEMLTVQHNNVITDRRVEPVTDAMRERDLVTTGRIYGVTPDHVFQEAGRGVIRQHDRGELCSSRMVDLANVATVEVPHTGDVVRIAYRNGRGFVQTLDRGADHALEHA